MPSGVVLPIEIFIGDFPEPGAGMGFVLNFTVGRLADKVIAESNPPDTVVETVAKPELPWAIVMAAGETAMVKLPTGAGAKALIRPLVFGLPQPVARS